MGAACLIQMQAVQAVQAAEAASAATSDTEGGGAGRSHTPSQTDLLAQFADTRLVRPSEQFIL